jgi:hypothetical protein
MTILIRHNKLPWLVIAALVLAGVGFFCLRGNASAEQANGSSLISYTPPSGPEMTAEGAANSAIKFARAAGVKGEVQMQIVRGTLARSNAVMDGQPVSAGEKREAEFAAPTTSGNFCFPGGGVTCSAAEVAQAKKVLLAEAQSGTYLVVLTATEEFKPIESVRPGQAPVYGKSMALVLNSHTGGIEGLDIGGSQTKPLAELGTATAFSFAAQSNTARTALRPGPPPWGILTGNVKKQRRWQIGIAGEYSTKHITTKSNGTFRVRLRSGRYVVTVQRSNGRVCAKRQISVTPDRETHVTLTCA